MFVPRALTFVALALFAAGCSGEHPTAPRTPAAPAPHFLQWRGGLPPQFSTSDGAQSAQGAYGPVLVASVDGLSLDRYTATFWAVRGEQRSIQINYLSATGDTSSPFLRLGGIEPSFIPGHGGLMPGDSVLITVTIDPTVIGVSLEPTGLLFRNPAQLQIWYGGAGGDLNGDRKVDDTDAFIESQLLGMWYREGVAAAWTRIPAAQSLADKSFTAALQHFSQYAVSW